MINVKKTDRSCFEMYDSIRILKEVFPEQAVILRSKDYDLAGLL